MQRLHSSNPQSWCANILTNRQVLSASQSKDSSVKLKLGEVQQNAAGVPGSGEEEELEVDYVFTATGYKRNAHEEILSALTGLLPESTEGKFSVKRDYSVVFKEGKVDRDAGIWLQGCNEGTHGVSTSTFPD